MFGIREEESAGETTPITVWSGPFYETFEASGRAVNGARRITLTTYNGDKVVVRLPDGVTLPRTDDNFQAIDRSISWALQDHYDERGTVTVGP